MSDELARHDNQTPGGIDHYTTEPGNENRLRIGMAVAAVVIALVSFFALGTHFSDPSAFSSTVQALDEKRNTVMNLIGASTGSSAAISLLPGDAGSAIAEKLVDLSSDFLVVISAIYLEKYLLTILGTTSFKLLIPGACLLVLLAVALWHQPRTRAMLLRLSTKIGLFGIAIFLVVPASVYVSGMIERTYEASINQTIQTAEQTTSAIEESASESDATNQDNPLAFLLQVPEELNKLTDSARNSLNNFIEALAVMIVTSCIIPILVLVFFLWLTKLILGIDIDLPSMPSHMLRRR